jgi:hypothetical protein
MEELLFKKKG